VKTGWRDIDGAGAFVLALALRQRRSAMPAEPRRDRNRCADGAALGLIARKIEHVGE